MIELGYEILPDSFFKRGKSTEINVQQVVRLAQRVETVGYSVRIKLNKPPNTFTADCFHHFSFLLLSQAD